MEVEDERKDWKLLRSRCCGGAWERISLTDRVTNEGVLGKGLVRGEIIRERKKRNLGRTS